MVFGCKLSSLGQKWGNTAGKLLQRPMIHCRPKAGYCLGLWRLWCWYWRCSGEETMEKVSQYPTTGAQQVADAWTRALNFFLLFWTAMIFLIQLCVGQKYIWYRRWLVKIRWHQLNWKVPKDNFEKISFCFFCSGWNCPQASWHR